MDQASPREESNFHGAVYGTGALPLCYEGELVGRVGFEPTFFLGKNQVQSSFAIDPMWSRSRDSNPSGFVWRTDLSP